MQTFFEANHLIIASVSGQAFFIIGLLAAWEFRRYSQLTLARPLWMLAAFGLFLALAEWGRLFIPIQETYLPEAITVSLSLVRVLLLAAGFGALLQFGIELLPPRSRTRLRAVPPVLFAIWIGLTIGGGGALWDVDLTLAIAEVQARLVLALPAGLVCALGLLLQQRYLFPLGGAPLLRWLRVAAAGAGLTGLALGLMVPPIGAWGGTEWLLGAPAELWRALAGAVFALGLARTLAVFQLEQDRALEAAEHQAIVAQTRDRLGRELSDRVAQHLYAVGLLLGEAASKAPAEDPLHHAIAELDVTLGELRQFMQDGESAAGVQPAPADMAHPTPALISAP
jgi:signal transduction histidine kinase